MMIAALLPAPSSLLRGAGALFAWWILLVAAHAEVLTLATYNIQNYLPADRMTEVGFRKEYPKPEMEKRALRRVIRGLNADVLVLQEMGDQRHLEELRRDLKAEGLDYPHFALAVAADADRHVAILAKRPLRNVVTHRDLEFPYFGAKEKVKRGLLEATIATEAGEVTLFGVHLKSRFTDRPDDPMSATRRAAEATAVRDRVLRRFPQPGSARFVILGDCNDHKASRPLAALQKRGKTEIAVLLPGADSRGEGWSHAFRKEESYSRVDHVLVSPALAAAVRGAAARIYDGDGVTEASDHRPVLVVLELEAERTSQPGTRGR
jgi:endonuclease/exonuclease/phosphatase family metal-dependent hydrolase